MNKLSILVGALVALGFLLVAATGGDHVVGRTGLGLMALSLPLFLLSLTTLFSPETHARTWLSVVSVLGGAYFIWRAVSSGPIGLALPDIVLVLAILVTYQVVSMTGIGLKKSIIVVLAIFCAANTGVAIVQSVSGTSYFVWEEASNRVPQVTGFFGHYNGFASFLNGSIFFFLSLVFFGRARFVRISCGLLVVGMLAALVLSGSRGGWVSFVAGGVLWLIATNIWLIQRKSKWVGVSVLTSLALGVAGILTSVWMVQKLSENRVELSDELVNQREVVVHDGGRLDFQQMAIEVFQDEPLWGSGPRAFSYASLQKWDPSEFWIGNNPPDWVHNEYLQTLTDYGAVGLVIILVVLLLHGIVGCYSVFVDVDGGLDPVLKVGALGGLAAMLCQCFFSFLMHFPSCAILAALQLGILASIPVAKRAKAGLAKVGIMSSGVLGIATSVSLVVVAVPVFQSFLLVLNANKILANVESVDDQIKALTILQEAGEVGRDPKIFEDSGRLAMTYAADAAKRKDRELAKSFNEQARKAFEAALSFNPHFPPAIAGLPRVHEALGNSHEANLGHEFAMKVLWSREHRLKPHFYASRSSMIEGYKAMAKGDDGSALVHFGRAHERILKRREILDSNWERPEERSFREEIEGWIAFHEARRLFREGDRIWKTARPRNPGLAYALMLEAEKRYQLSGEVVRSKDQRWERQVKQLQSNMSVFKAGRQIPAKISEKEISRILLPEASLDSEPSTR